ncbi:MAG: FKBP-type peptidyl-prolyl cis-trans isomerase [Acidiferrobacteraceae bacterium]
MIGHDSEVTMEFRLTLADGTPVDATEPSDPFTFRMGENALPVGVEARLVGLREGDERSLTVPASEAWGSREQDSIRQIPRSELPADWPIAPDLAVTFSLPDGSEVPATVVGCAGDLVEVDFSHPLAGYDIAIDVKILRIRASRLAL